MSEAQSPDAMKKLVVFITGLAIPGTINALAWYFAVELPVRQAALNPPGNSGNYPWGYCTFINPKSWICREAY